MRKNKELNKKTLEKIKKLRKTIDVYITSSILKNDEIDKEDYQNDLNMIDDFLIDIQTDIEEVIK